MKVNFLKPNAVISAALAAVRIADRDGFSGSIYNKVVQVLIYGTILILPLFYAKLTDNVLEFNKQMLLVIVAAAGLISWLLGVVVSGKLTFRISVLDKGILAVLAATIGAAVLSLTPAKSIFGLSNSSSDALLSVAAFSVLYFLAVNTLHDRGRALRIVLSISMVLALLVGVLQIFGAYLLPGLFTHAPSFNTVGSLNTLGILAAIMLPIFAKMSGAGTQTALKVLGTVGIVLAVLVLGILNWWALWAVALVGMVAMIGFDSVNATHMAEEYSTRKKRFALSRFVIPMTVIVVGAFLLLVQFNPSVLKREFPTEVSPSYQLSWHIGKEVMKERMLFGYGPENFSIAFDRFGASQLANSQLANLRFFDAMAQIFNVGIHTGALGLLAFILLLWSLIQAAAHFGGAISESVTKGETAIFAVQSSGVLAATVAAVAAMLVYPFSLTLTLVWYTLLALTALVIAGGKAKTIDIEARPAYSLSASLGFILGLILVLTGVYFSSMKYLAGIRYGQAFAQPEPSAVLTTLGRAIDLDATNDMYLRDASQVTLAMIRDEVNTAQKDSDIQRPQRIQNLITSSVQLAQRAVQVAPHESLNWSNLGTVYYALSGLVDSVERLAEDAFKKAAELRPGDPTFDQRIGEMWLNRADTVRELARNAGGSNAARLNQQANEALDQAKQAFQRALEVSPNYGLAIYNLGAIYDRQDKVSDAIAQLEKIAPYNTSNATISFELGLLYLRAGRKNDALAAMNRATLINPQYANARWYIALLLEERGDIDGALIQLLEIQKNNKENQVLRDKIVALQSGQRTPASTEVIDSEPLE